MLLRLANGTVDNRIDTKGSETKIAMTDSSMRSVNGGELMLINDSTHSFRFGNSIDGSTYCKRVEITISCTFLCTYYMPSVLSDLYEYLSLKYGDISPDDVNKICIPNYLEIIEIDPKVEKRGSAFTATIKMRASDDEAIIRGQTGKIVPSEFVSGISNWKELGKARIHECNGNIIIAELFSKTGRKSDLVNALDEIKVGDCMEVDNFGLSANLTSALSELAFEGIVKSQGFHTLRMPEDLAAHLMEGTGYFNYDFLVSKNGVQKRVEVKSLWGTNTDKARLIHARGRNYETSSCKFRSQDIFAVSLWLKTGNIMDFAYAISKYQGDHQNGLPCATKKGGGDLVDYVHQNPDVIIGNGIWFDNFEDVWEIAMQV